MHLPQIAAIPKVIDDLAESAGAARLPATGEGFQAVFSTEGEAKGEGSGTGREAAPTGSDRPGADPLLPGASLPEAPARAGTGGMPVHSGVEAIPGGEDGLGALPVRARVLASAGDASSDDRGAGDRGAGDVRPALPNDDLRETALPDGWVLPVLAASTSAAPASASGEAYTGSRFEGFSRARAPAMAIAEPARGEIVATEGATAGATTARIASADGAAAASGAVNPLSEGAEKLMPTIPQAEAGTSGSATRASAATPGPTPAMAGLNAGAPAQAAGAARVTGALPLVETLLPVDLPGGSGSEPAPGRPPPADGGAPLQAGGGQPGSPAGGIPLPPGSRALASEGRDAPVETGSATAHAEVGGPAAPKSDAPMMAAAAATTPAIPPAGTTAPLPGDRTGAADADDGLLDADPVATDPALGEPRSTARGPMASAIPTLHTPETSRQVAMQIAEVVRASGERSVELKLQPEELGRVHLTMSQDATGTLTVSLNVERAETLDLLRRNIELLRADLQELGYGSVDFSFQGDGAGREQNARAGWGDGSAAIETAAGHATGNPPPTVAHGAEAPGDGIDIRL